MATLEKKRPNSLLEDVEVKSKPLKSANTELVEGQHPCISLPIAFRIYSDKARVTYCSFYIGRQKGERLKAINVEYSAWGNTSNTLHEGPSPESPVIGRSVLNTNSIDVSLPSLNFQMVAGGTSSSMEFICSMPVGKKMDRAERFEWRTSRGEEMKRLGSRCSGWKLVRMDNPNSKHEEVVAVYSVDIYTPKLSGRFEFLGSGATDELGREWAIMAVVTALSLGQKKREMSYLTAALAF